jgi:lipoprotein-anchoring transpeptidase ErfK/SrfK
MKKRLTIICGIFIGLFVILFLFTSTSKKEFAPVKDGAAYKTVKSGKSLYSEARRLEKEGNLLEAKKRYKEVLKHYPNSNLVKEARARLDKLNIKILFSPIPTEDSIFYYVRPGDTLRKIANSFQTTVELIMKSNNLASTIIRPDMPLKISSARYGIFVDKSQNILMLKSNDEILKTYTVSTGANNCTPTGEYTVENKLVNPTWYAMGAVVPPESPKNILGTRWMGIDLPGYGIHGTTDESSIGSHITKGCVRMRNSDVEELYTIVPVGIDVTIID